MVDRGVFGSQYARCGQAQIQVLETTIDCVLVWGLDMGTWSYVGMGQVIKARTDHDVYPGHVIMLPDKCSAIARLGVHAVWNFLASARSILVERPTDGQQIGRPHTPSTLAIYDHCAVWFYQDPMIQSRYDDYYTRDPGTIYIHGIASYGGQFQEAH